jgi:hypothetical protein
MKISETIKRNGKCAGKNNPMYGKKGEKSPVYHKHWNWEETSKEKIRTINNSSWQNSKSFEPYELEFNKNLKEQIRQRDNHRCQQCFRAQDELYTKSGKHYKLFIHHIDYNKRNNKPENLLYFLAKKTNLFKGWMNSPVCIFVLPP